VDIFPEINKELESAVCVPTSPPIVTRVAGASEIFVTKVTLIVLSAHGYGLLWPTFPNVNLPTAIFPTE